MINLNEFNPIQFRGRTAVDESYIVFESAGSGRKQATIRLCRKDYGEVTKYLGNTVKVYTGAAGEFVLTRGDKRVSPVGEHGGKISLPTATEMLQAAFPSILRVYLKGEWDTDENGNKVFHLMPTGKTVEDERIVTGRRLEDKR